MKFFPNTGANMGSMFITIKRGIVKHSEISRIFIICLLFILAIYFFIKLDSFCKIHNNDNYVQIEAISGGALGKMTADLKINLGEESRFNTYDTIDYIVKEGNLFVMPYNIIEEYSQEYRDSIRFSNEYWKKNEEKILKFINTYVGNNYVDSIKKRLNNNLKDKVFLTTDRNEKDTINITSTMGMVTDLYIVNIIQNLESYDTKYKQINKDTTISNLYTPNLQESYNACQIEGQTLYENLTKKNEPPLSKKHTYAKSTKLLAGYNVHDFIKEVHETDYAKPISRFKWYFTPYDISREYYTISVCSNTIKDFNLLVYFTGPVSNFSCLGQKIIEDNGYMIIPNLKTARKFSEQKTYKIYVEYPELENIQYIRLFFVTALLSLVISLIIEQSGKLIKKALKKKTTDNVD